MKMNICRHLAAVGIAAISLSLAACDNEDEGRNPSLDTPTQISLPEGTRAVTESGNDFSFRLFREYSEWRPGNVAISPLNVMTNLAMLANGDNAEGRDEIFKALGIDPSQTDIETLNAYCQALLSQLPEADSNTDIRFANSLWNAPGKAEINPAFASTLSGMFDAEMIKKSPSGIEGMTAVNKWCSENTKGCIDRLLTEPLDERITTALLNAVYFKGSWKDKFDTAQTKAGIFHNADGSESEVEYMHQKHLYSYSPLDEVRAIRLPYGNGNFDMTIIMPEGDNNIGRLAATIDRDFMIRLNREAKSTEVDFQMPKFECETNEDLQELLADKFGVKRLFDEGLNSIYATGNFPASMFRHAVNIRVDEDGSEAAASTIVPGMCISPSYDTGIMKVDRPFIFIISESTTGAIIFIGQITEL